MLALVVHIQNTQSGETRTRAFHESPVRIGRSPFASLRLREPFVSEWQAVVRFHTTRTTYLDLGSKNPTHIDGRAMERNVEVEVSANTEVRIGTLRLRFTRSEQPVEAAEPVSDQQTAFQPNQFGEPERPTGTQLLPMQAIPKGPPPLPAASASRSPQLRTTIGLVRQQPPTHAPVAARAPASMPASPHTDPLLAAHHSYRRACNEFMQLVCAQIERTPSNARASYVLALRRSFPELMNEPAFREAAERAGIRAAQLGHLDVQDWLARLCGMPSTASPEQAAVSMERVGQLLEIFATAFIESRRAHQRAQRRLALDSAPVRATPLQQSEDPHALLSYLLSPEADVRERSQELRRSLADFAIHQIALLSAVVEGARTLLDQLGPQALRDYEEPRHAVAALDRTDNSSGGSLWPFATRKLWRKLLVRHHDLTNADHFTRALFGREFQHRYHAIADSSHAVADQELRPRRGNGVSS